MQLLVVVLPATITVTPAAVLALHRFGLAAAAVPASGPIPTRGVAH